MKLLSVGRVGACRTCAILSANELPAGGWSGDGRLCGDMDTRRRSACFLKRYLCEATQASMRVAKRKRVDLVSGCCCRLVQSANSGSLSDNV